MLKQIVALVILSIAITLSMSYMQHGLQFLIDAHDWISSILMDVFSGGQAGNLLRGLITLLSIPIFVGLVPTIGYWIVKRHWFPYFMEIVWVVWLLQAGALMVLYKVAA